RDANGVGHEVEHQPQPARAECVAEAHEVVPVADLWVERIVIGDVVAVLAPRARLQERRGIDMADAERVEIRDDLEGVPEREARTQLEAIGRARNRQPTRLLQVGSRTARRARGRDLADTERHRASEPAAREKLTNHGGSAWISSLPPTRGAVAWSGRPTRRSARPSTGSPPSHASSWSTAPPPSRQRTSTTRPPCSACTASPRANPPSRGTISRRRTASSARWTSSQAPCVGSARSDQSSLARSRA